MLFSDFFSFSLMLGWFYQSLVKFGGITRCFSVPYILESFASFFIIKMKVHVLFVFRSIHDTNVTGAEAFEGIHCVNFK